MNNESFDERFKRLNACVIIPTYNNNATIEEVIAGVLIYTDSVIVVNDGCTDNTSQALARFSNIQIVQHTANRGKGKALQSGFKAALQSGFRYAITIDSDGQHYAEDLPVFLDAVEKMPDAIIVGGRNMEQSTVPGKSSFGNKFSNFWFTLETGVKLPDTQSGYRLYPVQKLDTFTWITWKYEFEIEVLVRSSWAGIPVISVPVKVFYAPKEVRVSHFRPFWDFSRIVVLNTIFVLITLLYIKPRDFIKFFQKKNIIRFLQENFLNKEERNSTKVLSISFGVFMGIFPVWGFQLIIGLALCHFLKLNKALFVLAAHISIPPMIPFIIFASHVLGGWVLNKETTLLFNSSLTLESVKSELIQYYLGAVFLSFIAAIVAAVLSFVIIKLVPLKKQGVQNLSVNS